MDDPFCYLYVRPAAGLEHGCRVMSDDLETRRERVRRAAEDAKLEAQLLREAAVHTAFELRRQREQFRAERERTRALLAQAAANIQNASRRLQSW